jgi:hypothetical protein
LQFLQISIDAALPRTHEPFLVDLIELERAPLVTVLVLQPFTMVHGASAIDVQVINGTRNALFEDNVLVNDYLSSLKARVTTKLCPVKHDPHLVHQLGLRLRDQHQMSLLFQKIELSCAQIAGENMQ